MPTARLSPRRRAILYFGEGAVYGWKVTVVA
jgi:hypothetical protein